MKTLQRQINKAQKKRSKNRVNNLQVQKSQFNLPKFHKIDFKINYFISIQKHSTELPEAKQFNTK